MLLGFKRRFAPFVEEGSKTHTIRAERKRPPKAGEMCHCYVNPRQKTMRLLGRWPCVKVEDIRIYECGDGRVSVIIDGNELTPDEKNALAWRDGFRSVGPAAAFFEFLNFWAEVHGDGRTVAETRDGEPYFPTHGTTLDFHGHLIHWSRDNRIL